MATAQEFEFTDGDVAGSSGAYDEIEVPKDYEATVLSVDDYDNTADNRSKGWVWTFQVEGLPFKEWTSFSPGARWKLVELMTALGVEVEAGIGTVDPNSFIGHSLGVTVDWDPSDATWDGVSPRYRRLSRFFELVEFEDTTEVAPL